MHNDPRIRQVYRMNRRAFIAGLGGAVAWQAVARGQQSTKIPRVGILSPANSEAAATLAAFRTGIHDLGYVEGQTIILDFRLAKGNFDALPALAAELVRIPVDVIVTDTTTAARSVFDATRTIPIVMATVAGDPVAYGLAKSYARPGGNVTGMRLRTDDLSAKRLQLLKQAFPGVARVAVLTNPRSITALPELRTAEEAAGQLGVRLFSLAARTPDELLALAPTDLSEADGLLVLPNAMFWNNRATIIGIASTARLPAIYPEREYADDGGLIAYGPNAPEHFRLAAGYVDRILRGANPGDLPINSSSKFDFVLNLRTAHALGLTLSPEFNSAVNEVIE
jgi:putative tryptophan/tyrosine transport system substrate-binding protein